MRIKLTENAGCCVNVERAIALAREGARKYGKVYALGLLANNRYLAERLAAEGIITVKNTEEIPTGGAVVISAHGVAPTVYEDIAARGLHLIDATCPNIAEIHRKVAEYSQKGYKIVLIGDSAHREILGTLGWAKDAVCIADSSDLSVFEGDGPFLVCAQTTYDANAYEKIKEKIEKTTANTLKTVVFLKGICYTTLVRQAEAAALSQQCDLILVVGDSLSSNTRKLLAIAKANCNRVYLIENVSDLSSVANTNITMPGIIAGASTPKELIMEVINTMSDTTNPVDGIIDAVKTEEVAVAAEAVAAEAAPVAATEEVKPAKAEKKPAGEIVTMADAMSTNKWAPRSYREGMKVKATIMSVELTGVAVAVDGFGKNDSGFIDKDEMELDGSYDMSKYSAGDSVEAIIIPKSDPKSKNINLSKKAYDEILVADEAVKVILAGEEFSLVISQAIKGGLLGKIGSYTVFVPASQIRIGYVKNLEEYVGKALRLRILPPKEEEVTEAADGEEAPKHRPNPKRIVASQRIILEEEKDAREEAFWEVMQVNNIIKGKVKRFAMKDGKYFGVFVSIMNKDCLLHISDLSWTKIDDPATVLELNKSYDFVVLKVDRENDKVSLGYKQLQKQPYEIAAEKYHVGDVIKGKVERIKDFGAFISIEPGIDGLVHVSEICHKWIANANEVLKVGDEVEAKIISFEKNKITLSIKALIEPPVVEESAPAEAEATEGEEKPNRTARFNRRAAAADTDNKDKRGERRPRRSDRTEDDNEPHEYVSSTSTGATMADLFKNLDINKFDDEDGDK